MNASCALVFMTWIIGQDKYDTNDTDSSEFNQYF